MNTSAAAVASLNPKVAQAVLWLLSNPPVGRRLSILRVHFGLTTNEILQAWHLAAELRQ
jgi:hypothetical protein